MGSILLFLLRLMRHPVQWLGVDYEQFEILLRVKLKMDFRRTPAMYKANGQKKYKLGWQLGMYAIIGVVLISFFYRFDDFLLLYTMFFSTLMIMVGTTLITEFTSVLFDERENQILLPRPVSGRTLLLVRLVHIQLYLGMNAVALSLGVIILTGIKYGLATMGLLIPVLVIASWLTLLLATLIYLLLAKLVSPERFKDILSYFQIAMAILIFGGFQIMPRISDSVSVESMHLNMEWWSFGLPPVWLAGCFRSWTVLARPDDWGFVAITIAVTLLGGALIIRFLANGFDHVIAADDRNSNQKESVIEEGPSQGVLSKLKQWLCVSEVEKAGWTLGMAMIKRDRKFKQAVYPGLGYILVMAFIMLKPDFDDWQGYIQKLSESQRYLAFVFAGFFGLTAISQIPYTDTPEAVWIYRALPGRDMSHLLTGAMKAMIMTFYIPVIILLLIPVTMIWGPSIIPIMICGYLLILVTFLWGARITALKMPLSLPREMQAKAGRMGKMMLAFLLIGIVVGMVYLISLTFLWVSISVSIIAPLFVVAFFRTQRKLMPKIQ